MSELQTSILDINDDCLAEILSYMDIADICSIYDTCSRLQTCSETEFSRRWKQLDCSSNTSVIALRCILERFGPLVKGAVVKGDTAEERLTMLKEFCSASLEKITIGFCMLKGKKVSPEWIQTWLSGFKEIGLDNFDTSEPFNNLFCKCTDTLERLSIERCIINCGVFDLTFPKLTSLKYLPFNISEDEVKRFRLFLERHRHIKQLHISMDDFDDETNATVRKIAENLTALEELSMENVYASDESFHCLLNLEHLQKLSIEGHMILDKVLRESKSAPIMQSLRIQYGNVNGLALTAFQNLRVLVMFDCSVNLSSLPVLKNLRDLRVILRITGDSFHSHDVISTVQKMPCLEQIVAVCSYEGRMNQELYGQLVEIVRNRSHQSGLKFINFVCYDNISDSRNEHALVKYTEKPYSIYNSEAWLQV